MKIDGYGTKTLNIAAFLYTSGLHLSETRKLNREILFVFTPKDRAQRLVEDYFADKASVNPRELFARLSNLKDIIFEGGRNE